MVIDKTLKKIFQELSVEHNITEKQAENLYKAQLRFMRDCLTAGDKKHFESFISFRLQGLCIFKAKKGLFNRISKMTRTTVLGASWSDDVLHPGIDNTTIEVRFSESLFTVGDIVTPGIHLHNKIRHCEVVDHEGFDYILKIASGNPVHHIYKEQLYPGYNWKKIVK